MTARNGHPGSSLQPRGRRLKVVLYNPQAVFFTMPLALLAIGSELDPDGLRGRDRSTGASIRTRKIPFSRISMRQCASASRCSRARRSRMPCGSRAPQSARGPICPWSGAVGIRRCSRASACSSPPSMLRCADRARRHSRRSFSGSPRAARSKVAPAAPCGSPMARILRESGAAARAGRQIPGARLWLDSGRAILRAQGQAPTRLHLIAGLQFPLRVLLGPVRLRTQVGRARAGADGDAVEGVVGSISFR